MRCGGATPDVYPVDSVGEQAAVFGKVRSVIDRRYVVSGGRRYDRRAMHDGNSTRYDEPAPRLAPKVHDARFDLCVAMNRRNDWHDLE
jgi:hypothetical protein